MDELQFRKWFWKAMSDFVELAYRPPGLDKLKTDTYFGFNAVLEDDDCEEKFTGELKRRARELEIQRTLHLNYICGLCGKRWHLPENTHECPYPGCGGELRRV